MATYTDLFQIANDGDAFQKRVAVACVVAADTIRLEDPATAQHAERLAWAAAVLREPMAEAARMVWGVVAQNKSATAGQITGATDAQIQTAVDSCVNLFLG